MRAFLVAIIALAGCHGTPAKPAAQPPANRAGAGPTSVSDPLALLPASSDLVVKIDVAALRKSPLWTKYQRHVVGLLAPSFAGCGYDPAADLATITAGVPMGDELGIFVFRGLDRDRTLHCLETSKLETETTATFDGDIVKLVNKSGSINLITFLDAKTMVMQGSKGPTRETLAAALKVGAPLRQHRGYVALERKLQAGAAVAFMMPPGSKALDKIARERLGVTAREMYATVHLTDFVAIRATITMQSPADAAAILEASQSMLAAMRTYFQRYDVRVEGDKVLVDLEATEAQIQVFADVVKAMMPAGQ